MLTRRAWLYVFPFAARLRADERSDITKWLGSVVILLTEENAADFLRVFQRDLRDKLDSNIWALVRTSEVASSVDIIELKGEGSTRDLVADWYLDLKPRASSNPSEQRRRQIKMRIEKAKKGWTIIALEPLDFFRPM